MEAVNYFVYFSEVERREKMKPKKPLISIVIPIYGVEAYLKECLDSVICQTYKELEIILVDDGSPDRCGEIADAYALRDDRFKVIHKVNGGLSDARNVGIAAATGEFLFFLDSDDIINKNAIEELYSICSDNKADIAISSLYNFIGSHFEQDDVYSTDIKRHSLKNDMAVGVINNYNVEYIDQIDAMKMILCPGGIGHEAPGKLYRVSLWNGIQFPLGKIYEDYSTIYKVVLRAKKVGVLSEPIYGYRVREGSIMRSSVSEKNLSLIEVSENVTNNISKIAPELSKYAKYLQVRTNLKLLEGILNIGIDAFPEAQCKIFVLIDKERKALLSADYVRKSDKVKIISLMMGKRFFLLVYRLGDKVNMSNIRRSKIK